MRVRASVFVNGQTERERICAVALTGYASGGFVILEPWILA
jgi:hypothetical protein